jgi:outer membrane protein
MLTRLVAFVLVLSGVLGMPLSAHGAEDLRLLGVGVVTSTSPYRGADTRVTAVPIVVWDYKNFYVKGVEAGYHFYKDDHLTLSAMTAPRFMGYSSDDSDALDGMQDRRMGLDAGVRADFELPFAENFVIGAVAVSDVSSANEGQEYELGLSRKFGGEKFQFTPGCGVRYQSQRMVDYYYGVESGEARADRPEYEPGETINYFGEATLNFGIAKDWIVVTRAGIEFLGSEIKDSPIVDEDHLLTAVIGVVRKF